MFAYGSGGHIGAEILCLYMGGAQNESVPGREGGRKGRG